VSKVREQEGEEGQREEGCALPGLRETCQRMAEQQGTATGEHGVWGEQSRERNRAAGSPGKGVPGSRLPWPSFSLRSAGMICE